MLKCNGNSRHNSKMEANITLGATKLNRFDPIDIKTNFIKQKYVNGEFQNSKLNISPRSLDLKLGKPI